MSVLEEGYLIEEGGLTKFQKCYKRGVIFLLEGGLTNQNVTRGGSDTFHRFIREGLMKLTK